ncbi:MAG: hypothetical protein OXT07_15480 [bacterium]|nr:hypothetical protein [bacterium]
MEYPATVAAGSIPNWAASARHRWCGSPSRPSSFFAWRVATAARFQISMRSWAVGSRPVSASNRRTLRPASRAVSRLRDDQVSIRCRGLPAISAWSRSSMRSHDQPSCRDSSARKTAPPTMLAALADAYSALPSRVRHLPSEQRTLLATTRCECSCGSPERDV